MDATHDTHTENTVAEAPAEDHLEPLISLASALLDTDRLRIAAVLAQGPANRMEMAERTGISHRELLRHLGLLQYFGVVRLEHPAVRHPDQYSRYVLNEEAFRAARQALGKLRGRKPRPTDAREMTLETFMPSGKLVAYPRKYEQLLIVLQTVADRFAPDTEYKERDVNVILEEVNEDYCSLRRALVDYGYLKRQAGIYKKNG